MTSTMTATSSTQEPKSTIDQRTSTSTCDRLTLAGDADVKCSNVGTLSCQRCQLVAYCSTECQHISWTVHKQTCHSVLAKSTWRPDFIVENRTPGFVGQTPFMPSATGRKLKYLWGNTPALNILSLETNEGTDYEHGLSLLFAGRYLPC